MCEMAAVLGEPSEDLAALDAVTCDAIRRNFLADGHFCGGIQGGCNVRPRCICPFNGKLSREFFSCDLDRIAPEEHDALHILFGKHPNDGFANGGHVTLHRKGAIGHIHQNDRALSVRLTRHG